jgi:hypothetical protein
MRRVSGVVDDILQELLRKETQVLRRNRKERVSKKDGEIWGRPNREGKEKEVQGSP